MEPFAQWIVGTRMSAFVNDHSWVWPACETLHFVGLALVIGNVGLLDLRLLGVEKRIPVAPLSRFVRWAILGFAINLVTGITFFVGQPVSVHRERGVRYKLAFMALAGINVARVLRDRHLAKGAGTRTRRRRAVFGQGRRRSVAVSVDRGDVHGPHAAVHR